MIIKQFFTPGLAISSYLIYDETSKEGALIDPTRHIEQYIRAAELEKIKITHILETHVHADFVSGAKELKATLKGEPKIVCSAMGGKEWSPSYADRLISDHEEIAMGKTRLQAWHTPGHTPEHVIWIAFDDSRCQDLAQAAFTGDLLFVGSIGRPDLLGKEIERVLSEQLYYTVFNKLPPLPDSLEIYPAHGAGSLCGKGIGARTISTLGYERRCNPWLKKRPLEEWVLELQKNIPAPPPYFSRMKQINVTGMDLKKIPHELPPLISMQEALKQLPSCQVIDLRSLSTFSVGHLKGAIFLPIAPQFAAWAGAVLPPDKDFMLMVNEPNEAIFAIQSLKLIGIDSIVGVIAAKEWQSDEWNDLLHKMPILPVESVAEKKDAMFILDVRTPAEWNLGHIKEAHLIEMTQITESLEQLPKNSPIAVFCHSGTRASIVTSLLLAHGYIDVSSVQGGMKAWKQAGLPTVND